MWNPAARYLWTAQHNFISPVATISDSERKTAGDAIAAVKGWLEECRGQETDESVGRISIRSGGGAGKTIFMHRLLLDLSGDSRAPVPMFGSAEALLRHAELIATLRSTTDTLSAVVDVWLRIRSITIPAKIRESFISDFKNALSSGEVVLLLDGDDELRQQNLDRVALNLLKEVRYWVAAHRFPGPEFVTTHRWIALDDAWGEATVMAHIDQRWPAEAKAQMVKKVIAEVLRRHDDATKRAASSSSGEGKPTSTRLTKPEPHWLCQPRNLDLFLDSIDDGKIEDESDIRRAAESQPYLFSLLVEAAVARIDETSNLRTSRDSLCQIAVNDPTNTRRQVDGRAVKLDDTVSAQLRRLTELVGYSDKQGKFYIRHTALRGYFIAGQIAHELLDPFHALGPEDELAGDETWSKARREAVESWLKDAGPDPVPVIAARLERNTSPDHRPHPVMRRNLLELLISLERASVKKRKETASLSNLDLSQIAGAQLDLHLMKFDCCDFSKARLVDAELNHATFTECDFHGADLSGADAVAAAFNDCAFGADLVEPAQVKGMAIDRAEFKVRGSVASLQRKLLIQRGASLERSRYRGEFGRKFFEAQQAFLGAGVQRLEENHYLRAIEEAVTTWIRRDPASPVYLVDLMAGGSYQRVARLHEKFEQLHVLGIDRDPSALEPHQKFKWAQFEIRSDSSPHRALDFDIARSLAKAFGQSVSQAHVIVAKKAFHELDSDLQQLLIKECARVLRPGGRLIMFEDTPGLSDGDTKADSLAEVQSHLDVLRHRLGEDVENVGRDAGTEPADVRTALATHSFGASAAEQIGFANTWIMVKDWANLNRHEVRNRYFASVPQIRQWASEVFGPPRELQSDRYRLNPLIFNELGIQRVLDHLTREGSDRARVAERDEAYLSECIWDSERLKVLVDFTKQQLRPGSPLAQALDAKEEAIDLKAIDPALGVLNRADITAPTFNLPCTVLVFEKR
jgi:SAM-dependent methyltransferase